MKRTVYRRLSREQRIASLIETFDRDVDGYFLADIDQSDAPLILEALRALQATKTTQRTPTVFEHAGCRLERLAGSKLGRRGLARKRFGYRITHIATGNVKEIAPTNDHNISPREAKQYVETWSKMQDVAGDV